VAPPLDAVVGALEPVVAALPVVELLPAASCPPPPSAPVPPADDDPPPLAPPAVNAPPGPLEDGVPLFPGGNGPRGRPDAIDVALERLVLDFAKEEGAERWSAVSVNVRLRSLRTCPTSPPTGGESE
jgi:hypothetical protein